MKPFLIIDTECYMNFWLFRGYDTATKKHYILPTVSQLNHTQIETLYTLARSHTWVSFNGIHYDKPLIEYAICQAYVDELKQLSNKIIQDGLKPWHLPKERELQFDHIDLIEVVKGKGSLKKYGARMHSKKLQELPYAHDSILTPHQIINVTEYCGNDIAVTEMLFNALKQKIAIRERFGARYNIDLRSKSDAQVSEAVINKVYRDKHGDKPQKLNLSQIIHFKFEPPEWVNFKTIELISAFEKIKQAEFYVEEGLVITPDILRTPKTKLDEATMGMCVAVNNKRYKLGIGGLHSQEKSQFLTATSEFKLFDIDVTANYPQAIINSGRWPPAIGELFVDVFKGIKEERVIAKKSLKGFTDKASNAYKDALAMAEGGKIMINGISGKLKSVYSTVFAPNMFINMTVGNQLALLMLIESMELSGIAVMSANTDGILVMPSVSQLDTVQQLIRDWERLWAYETEQVEYSMMAARDVNNYIAVKTDGTVKRKGEFAQADLEGKDPYCEICSDAIVAHLLDSTPIKETIRACDDIRKFIMVESVTGGCYKIHGEEPERMPKMADIYARLGKPGIDGRITKDKVMPAYIASFKAPYREFIGKTIRYYYSMMQPGVLKSASGKTVGNSEGAQQMMLLSDTVPIDLDYNKYIDKANGYLNDIGFYNQRGTP